MGFLRMSLKSCLLIMLTIILSGSPSSAGSPDLKPPQVTVRFIFTPSPLIQYGAARLFYEMVITNYIRDAYVLESIDVDCGDRKVSYAGETLKAMVRFAGESRSRVETLRIGGGQTTVVFFMLQFDEVSKIPALLRHTLHFRSQDGVAHALSVQPLAVRPDAPILVGAPLHGSGWIAGDSAHNAPDAAHRRAILFDHGDAYLAQRYAIDWIRYRIVNGLGTSWSGPEDRNSSYFCYDGPDLQHVFRQSHRGAGRDSGKCSSFR
jgi:hypothetical protein